MNKKEKIYLAAKKSEEELLAEIKKTSDDELPLLWNKVQKRHVPSHSWGDIEKQRWECLVTLELYKRGYVKETTWVKA